MNDLRDPNAANPDTERALRAADPAQTAADAPLTLRAQHDLDRILQGAPAAAPRRSSLGVRIAGLAGALLVGGAAATIVATGIAAALNSAPGTTTATSAPTTPTTEAPQLSTADAQAVQQALTATEPSGSGAQTSRIIALESLDMVEQWSSTSIGFRVLSIEPMQTKHGASYRVATVEVLGATEGPYDAGDTATLVLRNEWPTTAEYQISDWFADPDLEVGGEYAVYTNVQKRDGTRFLIPIMGGQGVFDTTGASIGGFADIRLDDASIEQLGL